MDSFFLEYEIKYRQKKLLDESRRIRMKRARIVHKAFIFKKSILMLSEVLSALGIRTIKQEQNRTIWLLSP